MSELVKKSRPKWDNLAPEIQEKIMDQLLDALVDEANPDNLEFAVNFFEGKEKYKHMVMHIYVTAGY